MPMLALAEQVQVEVGQLRRIAVGVVSDMFPPLIIPPDEPVARRQVAALAAPFEKGGALDAFQAMATLGDRHFFGMG